MRSECTVFQSFTPSERRCCHIVARSTHTQILDKQSSRGHTNPSIRILTRLCVSVQSTTIALAEYTTRNRNHPARASDCGTLCTSATLWEIVGQSLYIPSWQKHAISLISFKAKVTRVKARTFETVYLDMGRVD